MPILIHLTTLIFLDKFPFFLQSACFFGFFHLPPRVITDINILTPESSPLSLAAPSQPSQQATLSLVHPSDPGLPIRIVGIMVAEAGQ